MAKIQLELNDYEAYFLLRIAEGEARDLGVDSDDLLEIPERNETLLSERFERALSKAINAEIDRLADDGWRYEEIKRDAVLDTVHKEMFVSMQQALVKAILAPDEKESEKEEKA